AEIDPIKYIPSSTLMYADVNVDAGRQFIASMKNSRLGQDVSRSMATSKNASDMKNFQMVLGMLQGFGHHVGIGMVFPKDLKIAAEMGPILSVAVPIVDPAAVRTEVKLAMTYINANNKMTWKDEPEGDSVVHVAVSNEKGGVSPSYAVTNDALLFSTSSEQVHSMLRQGAGGAESLAASSDFQNVMAHVDRSQFAWGYINGAKFMEVMPAIQQLGADAPKAGTAKAAANFDPTQIPGVKELYQANKGMGFSMGLHADRIDVQSFASYVPDSTIGKLMASFKPTALTAPGLVTGHPLFFVDFADMPHWASLYTQIFKPLLAGINTAVANSPDTAMAGPVFEMITPVLDDVVNGSGNEMAFAVGPLPGQTAAGASAAAGTKPALPPLTFFIQKSDNPRLTQGMHKILDLVSNLSSEKWYTKNVMGTDVQILGPADSPIRPVYAPVRDFHVLAMDLGALKTPLFLAGGNAPGKSFADSPDFQKIMGVLGPQTITLVYLDLHALVGMGLFDAARTAASKYGKVPAAKGTQDSAVAQDFARAVGQIGAAYYPDPSGLLARFVMTFNPDAAPEAQVAVAH
ncbi:MAG: DUF3352 domain-containing protein, partial [Chloroflexi bacterium]|nr:DUF3352 domain-containing protein [Chloroflexota bacterium]